MYSNYYFASPKSCRTTSRTSANKSENVFRPKMNVQQNDDSIILEFSLAGVAKEDVKLNIQESILELEAQRKLSNDEKNYQYREFGPVTFKTSLRLPDDVSDDSVRAQFQSGILRVEMKIVKKPGIQVEIK